MKVLVVNQYYKPDKASSGILLADLCEDLAEKGYEVTVVCGYPSYTDDAPDAVAYERNGNLQVFRVSTGGVKGRIATHKRVWGYLWFLINSVKLVVKLIKEGNYNVIITVSNPPFVGLLGALAKKRYGIPFIYSVHDIHPDLLLRTGKINSSIAELWDRVNNYIFKNSDRVIVCGERMKDTLFMSKGVDRENIYVINNWPAHEINYDSDSSYYKRLFNFGSHFTVLYSGNMGISHNLEWLIDVAEELSDQKILFILAGDGQKRQLLGKEAQRRKLENVIFMPYQPEDKFNELLLAGDIHIVSLEPELAGLAVPCKTYSSLAAGRPIVALAGDNDDVGDLLLTHKCGWIAHSSDELKRILQDLSDDSDRVPEVGMLSRSVYENNFSRERSVLAYCNLINSLKS